MPIWLDRRYVNLVSPKLLLFKWKKPTLANFRCPFCSDSQKNKKKARGYFFTMKGAMLYKCHNCPESRNLGSFLKEIDPNLYNQYQLEVFIEKNPIVVEEIKVEPKPVAVLRSDFPPTMAQLPNDHFAKQYILGRHIPKQFFGEIYYVENMNSFVKEYIDPDQESPTDPHIAIIIRDKLGAIVGVNGRSLKPNNEFSKYCKAKISADVKLIFGVDRLVKGKDVYVFEGEFDAMFVENSIAVGGINMMFDIEKELGVNKSEVICVIDKDQRNKDVIKAAELLIEKGYAVVLFPATLEGKDINDFVMKHEFGVKEIDDLLTAYTYSGLLAKLQMTTWKKYR